MTFTVRRDTHGRRAPVFVAWLIRHVYARAEAGVLFYPDALPAIPHHTGLHAEFRVGGLAERNASSQLPDARTSPRTHDQGRSTLS